MSHHYSGADFGFPLDDARLDFCDLYAFPKPGDAHRSIVIMDVHPSKASGPIRAVRERGAERDARFVDVMAHSLEHTGGYSPEEAKRVAGTLLPDIMRYDPTRPVAYPDNGRTLTDDVTDPFMAILTNGRASDDQVGPHDDLLPEFPYLGPPHENRAEA